jgi:hypothetical protein
MHCGEPKDRDHIILCSFAPRQKWQSSLLLHLWHAHDSNESEHYLLDILIAGLHCWFTGTTITVAPYPKQYHILIAKQTAIGWCHMFNGHRSQQWRIKQDYYVGRQKICTRTHTGSGWSLRTLTIIWKDFFLLWTAQNKAIHGHDLRSQNQLGLKMELLHTHRKDVLADNADIFIGDNPIDSTNFLEKSSASHVQNWLNVWKPSILSSVKSATGLSLSGVNTLQNYFQDQSTRPRRPIATRAHCKARPKLRTPPALLQPSSRFCSLRSFFGATLAPLPSHSNL